MDAIIARENAFHYAPVRERDCLTLHCDFCGWAFPAQWATDGFSRWIQYERNSGSDHLATWCAECGPIHRTR